jgi:pimeloyl-ACP methyl ester carboxylesterase
VASYRSRMRWAERLSAAGYPTLRFDLPAVGNSPGAPSDEGLMDSWLAAVDAAAIWLRDHSGAPSIALLGLGFGGLLAREAIARGAPADQLIAWAPPASGRAFSREVRAFSKLQRWGDDGEAEVAGGPGSVEAGGFLLAAETKAALAKLDPAGGSTGNLRRALLLERDGVGTDPSWIEGLRNSGVEVEVAPGDGWMPMVAYPDASRLSAGTTALVERWLAADAAPATATPATPGIAQSESRLLSEEGTTETPWEIEQPSGRLFGILTEPATSAGDDDLWAVFLNAGAVRHVGPNRLWTEGARRAASHGVPSLRVDLEAIGESGGDETRFTDVAEFYTTNYVAQVRTVLDDLQARGAKRFILIGLCSGGYWSFQSALRNRRIESVVLLNAGALVWRPQLLTDRAIGELGRFRDRDWWRRLFAGELNARGLLRLTEVLWAKTGQLLARLRATLRHDRLDEPTLEQQLNRLSELGTSVTLAFSAGEGLHQELESEGVFGQLERWPNVHLESLPNADHSLRPLAAQRAAAALVDKQIAELCGDLTQVPPARAASNQ